MAGALTDDRARPTPPASDRRVKLALLAALFAGWSQLVLQRTRSTRMAAVALFTTILTGFVILTYVATVHRGPNWNFYWSPSQWPVH